MIRLISVLILCVLVLPARAVVTNLSASADTFILQALPSNNAGAHSHAASGEIRTGGSVRRGLYQFDVSGIPAGSTINAVSLKLTVVLVPGVGPVDSTFDLKKLTRGWTEGTRSGNNGQLALNGQCTWGSAMHNQVPWDRPGGGGDFVATASASTPVSGFSDYLWTGPGMVDDVQAWVDDGPGANHGWILISQSEHIDTTARAFGTKENAGANNRPVLTVDFTPPVPTIVPEILVDLSTNRVLRLRWDSDPNLEYDIVFSTDLNGGTGSFQIAEAYLPSDPVGTNTYVDMPVFAHPELPALSNALYRVRGITATNTPLSVQLTPVATGLIAPVVLTHAGDGSRRLFVAEQTGQIRIIDAQGVLLPTPFLDLSQKMTNLNATGIGGINTPGLNTRYDERGLLGLVFHPDYEDNGRFFVYYSSPKTTGGIDHESIVAEYRVSGVDTNLADTLERVILRVDQPEFNHNGGALAFGPDDCLYISLGDGGGANDVHGATGNGQDINNRLGSILRIDVDQAPPFVIPPDNPFVGVAGHDAIYAYGFRNPFRMSFGGVDTNLFFVADVGQDDWEEINLVEKGGNYGWRVVEANHAFDLAVGQVLGIDVQALQYPINEYHQTVGGLSAIGGYLYRGAAFPRMQGSYVFGDFSGSFGTPTGRLYYLQERRPGLWKRFEFDIAPPNNPLARYVKGFGEDENGELYLLSSTILGPEGAGGEVLRIDPPPLVP